MSLSPLLSLITDNTGSDHLFQIIILVVDSTDRERLTVTKEELHRMLIHEVKKQTNKQTYMCVSWRAIAIMVRQSLFTSDYSRTGFSLLVIFRCLRYCPVFTYCLISYKPIHSVLRKFQLRLRESACRHVPKCSTDAAVLCSQKWRGGTFFAGFFFFFAPQIWPVILFCIFFCLFIYRT